LHARRGWIFVILFLEK
jgi:hypothetical protein